MGVVFIEIEDLVEGVEVDDFLFADLHARGRKKAAADDDDGGR